MNDDPLLTARCSDTGPLTEVRSPVGIFQLITVIIEDTLGMFKEFISSQTVRKNYYPPDNNLESDWLVFGIEDPIMGR